MGAGVCCLEIVDGAQRSPAQGGVAGLLAQRAEAGAGEQLGRDEADPPDLQQAGAGEQRGLCLELRERLAGLAGVELEGEAGLGEQQVLEVIAVGRRVWPGLLGGGEAPSYICWGHNNRSAMVRVPMYKPRKSGSTRIEVRSPDSATNPYLCFAVLLAARPALDRADCLVVVAGMEGALPSVIGGLVGTPMVAVPTSVGYGASFGGLAALLAMLNACAPGIAVVNIDNGFGAGVFAARVARRGAAVASS